MPRTTSPREKNFCLKLVNWYQNIDRYRIFNIFYLKLNIKIRFYVYICTKEKNNI
jgi:hypothetical protein